MNCVNNKSPKQIGDSISYLLKKLGIETKVKQHQAIENWTKIVGDTVSDVTEANKVIDGILFVKVVNSTWRNELIYMKKDIMQRMNNSLGAKIIRDIRFK